ncbi:ABC transporter permease [Cypionkella sp.]|uniref:ABC transporter permease n=1 Tax=Cypionkella sp. TaxID=2811411 RepID=UPI002ABD01BF|nr:ABC transporter permease [Cypionkella sp.]MDZ4395248.1 ABC transporter permease [Cypionkella sp.]
MTQLFGFLWRRALAGALTVIGAVALLFLLIQFVPGDLASVLYGPRATPELRAVLTERMGLDRSIPEQLWLFLSRALRGDFGTDVISGRPILQMIGEVLPNTLFLAFAALGLSLLLGVPLGALAAVRPGSLADRVLGVFSVVLITTPSFVIAILLLLAFSLALDWLPVAGAGTAGDPMDQALHLILPTTALALGWVGYLARLVRAALLEVLAEQHVRTLRAYGVAEWRILLIYAMRPALIPVVAILGVALGDLIGSALFAEIIFARPGIGTLSYNAVASRNFAVVQAATVIIVLVYVTANIGVEIISGLLDPRFRRAVTRDSA